MVFTHVDLDGRESYLGHQLVFRREVRLGMLKQLPEQPAEFLIIGVTQAIHQGDKLLMG